MRLAAFLFAAALAFGVDPPKDVGEFFRTAVGDLGDKDKAAFLDHFDGSMPGYAAFRDDVTALLDRSEVIATVAFVTDEGDASKRVLQLDWFMQIDQDRPRRQIVKCTLQKQGKKWKIVAFDPVDLFRP